MVSFHFPCFFFLPLHQQMFVFQATGLHRLLNLNDSQMSLRSWDFMLDRSKMLGSNSEMCKILNGKYMFWCHSLSSQTVLKPIYCICRRRLSALDSLWVWQPAFCYHSQSLVPQIVFSISFTGCSQVTEVCRDTQHLAPWTLNDSWFLLVGEESILRPWTCDAERERNFENSYNWTVASITESLGVGYN